MGSKYSGSPAKAGVSDSWKPLVDQRRCAKCRWRHIYTHHFFCGYMFFHDHSRTSLHPEGLSADCKEFEPRQRTHKYQAKRR